MVTTIQPGQPDQHSFANFDRVRVKHVSLTASVDLENELFSAVAALKFRRMNGCPAGEPLIVDTNGLKISSVKLACRNGKMRDTAFTLGQADPILGAPLTVPLTSDTKEVVIEYSTSADCMALQWLPARPGRKGKFLFSQGQAILTRSWIPLQDCPAVRVTYDANITVPAGMMALMSADHLPNVAENTFSFKMPLNIPPYLIAICVGDLAFRELGPRTGVYAEPDVLDKAAWEFADAEKILIAAEKLNGKYKWGRFDILVLPASFPFGGMENPKLTFVTPTLLAGDRSLVRVLYHELEHSWTGNEVTNASASDFFLNEGWTVWRERRIIEKLEGKDVADMAHQLGLEELKEFLKKLPESDQILHINLDGRDPDDGCTRVPYEKGALFLRTLEQEFGAKRFDKFFRRYLRHFDFKSITTDQFVEFLQKALLNSDPAAAARVDINEWLYRPGLPAHYATTKSARLDAIDECARRWLADDTPVKPPDGHPELGREYHSPRQLLIAWHFFTRDWKSDEWLRFLRVMPQLSTEQMRRLDRLLLCHNSNDARFLNPYMRDNWENAEITFQWLTMCIRNKYSAADHGWGPADDVTTMNRVESFLAKVGRRKFALPLYRELVDNGQRPRAQELFERFRGGYHPLLVTSIENLLQGKFSVD